VRNTESNPARNKNYIEVIDGTVLDITLIFEIQRKRGPDYYCLRRDRKDNGRRRIAVFTKRNITQEVFYLFWHGKFISC
jgi:hypothetical protein